MASEAYHDWSGEAVGARLLVNFTLKLLLSQNFCNRPLMRFIRFAFNIGPTAAIPAGLAPVPLICTHFHPQDRYCNHYILAWFSVVVLRTATSLTHSISAYPQTSELVHLVMTTLDIIDVIKCTLFPPLCGRGA